MTSSSRWFQLISVACAALASLLFIPGLHGGFILDDTANIVENQVIRITALNPDTIFKVVFGVQPAGLTRILPTLSFALDYWRGGGLHPEVFKATSIAIHALTTLVLAGFFRALFRSASVSEKCASLAAPLLALAWAAHPLQVSSVLYIVQRMQTLCTLFIVLALWSYLKARKAQIEGEPSRTNWLLTGLMWVLALGCKEDAALLPAYTLAMELTVLGFQAKSPELAGRLRKGYLFAVLAGTAMFLLVVVPHFWSSGNYPNRDFSSWERLLTEGRVLCMYLWEILLPLPRHMPFYYDWVQPSQGLFEPWGTLPAILLVLALLVTAWHFRARRPLFALGIFLFFAGHFITSNVVNLELAFEHRNHFPMIGIILAIGDCLALAGQRLHIRPIVSGLTCALLLMLLSSATVIRAITWGNPTKFVTEGPVLAPGSARAWYSLCVHYYELGGGHVPNNRYRDKAIDTCSKGAASAPYSLTNITSLVVFKTWRGDVTQADWDQYLDRLKYVNLGPENSQSIWSIINNVRAGVPLNEDNVYKAIDIVSRRGQFRSGEYAAIGYFALGQTHQPDRAYPYFERSVEMAAPNNPLTIEIIAELNKKGRTEWATRLGNLARNPVNSLAPHPALEDHPR